MRKIVLAVGISLDGYIARPDGAVDYLFMPKDYSMAPLIKTLDTVVMGRKTYEVALKLGGIDSGSGMTHYIFSRSQPPGERDGVIFTRETPKTLIARLRRQKGKNIWLMGGGELTLAFLKADLVDEMELGIVPVLLGAGIPAFPGGFPQRNFALVESNSYSRGLVVMKYRRIHKAAKGRKK